MSLLDKNKLFFGLIHYVLSEQKNVDWILKTSIADFLGVNLDISEFNYTTNDIMKNMIDFLYDIKPYHTQFNKYIEKISAEDNVNANIIEKCDETLKIRYDAITTKVDDIIGLYLNGFEFYAWELTQDTIEWGTQKIYNVGDVIKYNDKVYKIYKKYIPTSDEFIFNPKYMNYMPNILYTQVLYPTYTDKLYTKNDLDIDEVLEYTLEEVSGSQHKKISVNDIEYTLDNYKTLFQDSDIVDICNTHKANRLCLIGLNITNTYSVIKTDDESALYNTLYILDNKIKEDNTVYSLVESEKEYDENNSVVLRNTLKYKMDEIGTIKSISYDEDNSEFMTITVNMKIDNEYVDVEYINHYYDEKTSSEKIYDVFNIVEPNYDRIIDALNAHFKGIEINGGKFDIDNYGYDEYPYDSEKYDSPTVEVDYCMIVSTENVLGYGDIDRTFVNIGENIFSIDGITKSSINIKLKKYNGEIETLDKSDYILDRKYITLNSSLKPYEELYISDGKNIKIYYAHPFIETDNDTIKRVKRELEEVMLFEPIDTDYALSKYFVHKENKEGRVLLSQSNNDYYVVDGKIEVHNLEENEHIIISSYDYRNIYDKIYSYDDTIGRSNNTVIINGEGMLRPFHEADRTDEKIASRPIDGVFYLENKTIDDRTPTAYIRRVNNTNDIEYMIVEMPSTMRINGFTTVEETGLTTEIVLNDATLLHNNIPGRIYILHQKDGIVVPSELIEYQDIRDNKILTGIKRAREGTPLYIGRDGDKKYNELLSIGDYVYNADKTRWFNLSDDRRNLDQLKDDE